ncbi:hypothetical protein CO112_00595 [Candidatus Dojkabacteria bacterium CG_4_9_14_3_um_filter_150_Dojkabacteria_WS6_41_13]|nr:MAG: hypothetical protein COZ14_00165 [Candidatus Dojkabacteria bacterium CG_4_10_14_3_um_filter_Dojkabacteria_WS6_41_9]PJB23558.1 MAG: hypothetical protein CO112_00595 [Candidatus Dojkabacteria bacterium CG_4_9_14_3_um_filter_150_Dojkabacteria_WS6_41_13]
MRKGSFSKKLQKFFLVNLWVEKFRMQAFGWWYYIDVLYTLVSKTENVFTLYFIGLILNEIQRLATAETKDLAHIISLAIILTAINLFTRLLSTFYWRFNWYKSELGFGVALERALNDKLISMNWEHIENPTMEKSINMISMRAENNMRKLGELHVDIIAIAISTVMAIFAAKISLIIIAIIFLKELPSIIIHSKSLKMSFRVNDALSNTWIQKSNLSGYYRSFPTLLEIKISQAFHSIQYFYNKAVGKVHASYIETDKTMFPYDWGKDFLEIGVNMGIYFYYATKVIYSGMLIGTFQYTTSIANELGANIYRLLRRVNDSYEYFRYSEYAYDVLTFCNTTPDGDISLDTERLDIQFDHVWFKYSGSKKYALKDINIHIADNDRLAIVGENGAGKSTFLKLLNLLYYPTKGRILINGIPLNKYIKSSLYSKLAVVTQEFARYNVLTVSQNIAIFGNSAKINTKKVRQAAELADAASFVEKLHAKYETYLTKKMEGGTELSTGQWQRLAVARQFYANRPLVILDEPTSAIDPIAEAKIFNNLYEHVKDKTVIVVSHRYNTVRAAKKILVFNDGQIIEQGNHSELLKKKGYYATAFSVQQEEKKL